MVGFFLVFKIDGKECFKFQSKRLEVLVCRRVED